MSSARDPVLLRQDYRCERPLNLYKSAACHDLVTQAAIGRHLRFLETSLVGKISPDAFCVYLCEDDYPGWLPATNLPYLAVATQRYVPPTLTTAVIQTSIPSVLSFARAAMAQPNTYLWGGTLGPDYDCSGLVQAAFLSAGIVLPRDSYQQEAFVDKVTEAALQPGNLIFFGTSDRTTHVALYLGEGQYIHSSGKDQGRNGIGIDSITDLSHPVSRRYRSQIVSFGRVSRSYAATGVPMMCRNR